jgi:uncharacterized membrane protein (UPF0127 family)
MMEPLRIRLACSLSERLVGLLKKDVCPEGEVLALLPCKSVHTFGMREPLDIAFIDAQAQVLKVECCVQPGRLLACKGAVGTLERRSTLSTPWVDVGDSIKLIKKLAESDNK